MTSIPARKKPARRRTRWARRAAVALVALACAGYGLAQTRWARLQLGALATDALRTQLGVEVTLREVGVSLGAWPPRIIVSARRIEVPGGPPAASLARSAAANPLLLADKLRLSPSLTSLLLGRFRLSRIEVYSPRLHLVVRDGRIVNLPPMPRGTSGEVELPFRRLIIHSAAVTVDGPDATELTLNGIELDLRRRRKGALDVEVEATGGGFLHHGRHAPVGRLYAKVRVEPGRSVQIERVHLESARSALNVERARIPLPFRGHFTGRVGATVELDRLAQLPLGVDLPRLDGLATVTSNLAVDEHGARGHAHATLRDVHIEGYGLGTSVDLDATFDPAEVRLTRARFDVVKDGGVVGVRGTVDLRDPSLPLTAQLDIDHLELARLLDQLGVTPDAIVRWPYVGDAALTGTLRPLDLRGPIHVATDGFRVTTGPWHESPPDRVLSVRHATVDGEVSVRPRGLGFEHLRLDTGRTRARVDVLIGFSDYLRVAADLDPVDLRDITPLAGYPITGRGRVRLLVEGSYGDPRVSGHLALEGFSFDGLRFGAIDSDWQLVKGGIAVRFPHVAATLGQSRYAADDLLLDFSAGRFAFDTRVHATALHLRDLYTLLGVDRDERFDPYQGLLTGAVDLRYTSGFEGDGPSGTLRGDMDLRLPTANLAGFAFTDGTLRGRFRAVDWSEGTDGMTLDLDALTLHKGAGTLVVMGAMGLGGALRLTVAADQLRLQQTEGLAGSIGALGGQYSLLGTVRGTLSVPRVQLDVGLYGLHWGDHALGDGRLRVRLTDRSDPWVQAAGAWSLGHPAPREPCASARAGLAHGRWAPDPPLHTPDGPRPALARPMAFLVCGAALDGHVHADMAIGWTRRYPLRGRVDVDGLDLTPFLADLAPGRTVSGSASGHAVLTGGALRDLGALAGEVTVSHARVMAEGVPLETAAPVRIALRGDGFDVLDARLTGPDSHLTVAGGGSVQGGLALRLDGSIGLGFAGTLFSSTVQEASGRVRVQARVEGPPDDPAVFGSAAFKDATIRVPALEPPIEQLSGELLFNRRRISLANAHARFGGGQVDLNGTANISDRALLRYSLSTTFAHVTLEPEEGLEVGLSGDATLAWQRGERLPTLRGKISIDHARYTRRVDLAPTLGELNRPTRAPIGPYDPADDHIALDLELVSRAPIRVRNNLADMDLTIASAERPFRLVGTDQRVGAIGTVRVPRGKLRFRSTELDVLRGVVQFDDRTDLNPSFDLTAVTTIHRKEDLTGPSWRITLNAHGNLDGFRIDASSVPPMSQRDLMLLLTIGMTSAETERLQAGDLGSTALEALTAVSGVDEQVTDALRVIDTISLTTVYSQQTNRPEPQVTIGKQLSDHLRLSASTGLSSTTRDVSTSLEWQLGAHTSLQASYDNVNRATASSFGNLGVDFRWRLEIE